MTGPQDVDVDWLANGELIQPALLDYKMQFNGERCRLLLRSVHEDDSGCYTCKLTTAEGGHPVQSQDYHNYIWLRNKLINSFWVFFPK